VKPLLLFATRASAQVTGSYTALAEFMNLFFDFTGSEEPDYPGGQPTLGQLVTQSAKESAGGAPGPLVLVVGSDIYVYDTAGGARFGAERPCDRYQGSACPMTGSRSSRMSFPIRCSPASRPSTCRNGRRCLAITS
jgi:hypothetical protein